MSTDFPADFSLAFCNKRETTSLDENGRLISFYWRDADIAIFYSMSSRVTVEISDWAICEKSIHLAFSDLHVNKESQLRD